MVLILTLEIVQHGLYVKFFGLQLGYSNLSRYGSDIYFENRTVWSV